MKRLVLKNNETIYTKDELENVLNEVFDYHSSVEIANQFYKEQDLDDFSEGEILDYVCCNFSENEEKQDIQDELENALSLLDSVKSKSKALEEAKEIIRIQMEKLNDIFAI